MCLHHAHESDECCESANNVVLMPQTLSAEVPRPAAGLPAQEKRSFLLELDMSTESVRISDPDNGRLLTVIDHARSEQIFSAGEGADDPALDTLIEALFGEDIRPLEPLTIGSGLATKALEQQLDESSGTAQRKTRRKLWELPHKMHCPVIGTCLDAQELRRVARKAGARSEGELSDYDVHVSFVAAADDRNTLSLAAHKALEKKFATQVRRFARAKTTAQVEALWSESLARGEVPGGLWATLTHPACSNALKVRTFEEIHMLSHQIGAGQRADLARLTEAEAELAALQRDFDAAQRRQRRQLEDREQRITDLERELAESQQQRRGLRALHTELEEELAELRSHNTWQQVKALSAQLAATERDLATLTQRSAALDSALIMAEQELSGLQTENAELIEETGAMERFIAQSLTVCDSCASVDYDDANADLGGRRILCVGGRNRLIEQYRELVARCNGRFEHHDGGLEDNRQRLDALLASADAVLCATDAISHDAYYRAKRFCKRHEKPHVFLRTSGIGSFARALFSISR